MTELVLFAWVILAGALGVDVAAANETVHLYADSVPDYCIHWHDHANAEGSSDATWASENLNAATKWWCRLYAISFDSWTLPPNMAVSEVRMAVRMRFTQPWGNRNMLLEAYRGGTLVIENACPLNSTDFVWLCNSVIPPPAGGWTKSEVDSLGLRVRAETDGGPINSTWLYCSQFRLTVTLVETLPENPPNPVVDEQQCGSAVLERGGSPPSGETWYWQGTSCGTRTHLGSGPTYVAAASGTYYIRAYSGGGWSAGCGSVAVTVSSELPPDPTNASAAPAQIQEGESSELSASVAGAVIDWRTGACDGSLAGTGNTLTVSPTTTTTYYARARYSAYGCESAGCDVATVEVVRPPVAIIVTDPASPQSDFVPFEVEFNGSDSYDSDGQIESYAWDFDGDGTTDATGPTVTHTYETAGTYEATLTVTDDDGLTDTDSVSVQAGRSITIHSPTAADEFTINDTLPVAWSTTGISEDVRIILRKPGSTFKYHYGLFGYDDPAQNLPIPDDLRTGPYYVRVRTTTDPIVRDDSEHFIIRGVEEPDQGFYVNRTYMRLGRELVGVPRLRENRVQVFLSWRTLTGDRDGVEYEIRRSDTAGTDCSVFPPLTTVTTNNHFDDDTELTSGATYYYCVQPVWDGEPFGEPSNVVAVTATSSIDSEQVPIVLTLNGCGESATFIDAVVPGDLNGDGLIDLVVRYCDQSGGDTCNSHSTYYVEAFLRDQWGKWQFHWCRDTESRTSPVKVWDLNQDGAAEVVTVENNTATIRVRDGSTGTLMASASNAGTDENYKHFNVAYLDGVTPFLVAQTDPKNTMTLNTFRLELTQQGWELNAVAGHYRYYDHPLGAHSLPVGDLDGDGFDEIVPCGKALGLIAGVLDYEWQRSELHNDACWIADIVPNSLGLEVLYGIERNGSYFDDGLGVLRPNGSVEWTKENSSFEYQGRTYYFHGWNNGWCFNRDQQSGETLECYALEICEQSCLEQIPEHPLPERYVRSWILDGADGDHDYYHSNAATSVPKFYPLDWNEGDGIVEAKASGFGVYPDRNLDMVGDSRAEVIRLGMPSENQLSIYLNASANSNRYMSPLHDPNYLKTVTQGGAGKAHFAIASFARTFNLACDVDAEKMITMETGEEITFLCGLSSLQHFAGGVNVLCATVPAGVTCELGLEKQSSESIYVPEDESVTFRVYLSGSAPLAPADFSLLAESGYPLLDRELWFKVEVE